jgi:23S rRNA (pseudouridine1915-N3)-methyltransferase
MKIRVLTVGKGSEAWADRAVADYARRLKRWVRLDAVAVKPARFRGDVEAVRAAEAERLLGRLAAHDRLVCLDERGEALDTDSFVELVDTARHDPGTGRLVFALGGAYGHGPEVRQRAWRTVRLSRLVLNHEVARVVLYEQLYRAWAILQGVPYHH